MAGEQDEAAGKLKELGGKVTGDKRLEGEGQAQNAAGKAENAVEGAGDKARGALDAVEKKLDRKD